MWKLKQLFLFITVLCLALDGVQCKKKSKRPKKNEEADDIVTYSPYFGDDFKPSSVEMQGNFQGMGPETTTMGLYAPAFPTSEDTTPFSIFASNGQVSQSFSPYLGNMAPADSHESMHSLLNEYHSKLSGYDEMNRDKEHSSQQDYDLYDQNMGDSAPVYGTKLNAKDTTKKPSLYGDALNYQSIYNYASTWPTTNADNLNDVKVNANAKNKFKKGPPPSDFTDYKGTFQRDYSQNSYPYPTQASPTKDSYQSMTDPFSTTSPGHYTNIKDSFSTSYNDGYQNIKTPISTGYKYQDTKDPMSPNFKSPYQNTKTHYDTPSTGTKNYHTIKDTYSGSSYSYGTNSNGGSKEAFDFIEKDAFKPTVDILPNNYKKYKSQMNYTDPKYDFKNTEIYSTYKDQYKPKPTESSSAFNSLDYKNWKGTANTNNYATIKDASNYNDYSSMQNAYHHPEYVAAQSSVKNVIDFTGENNPFKDSYHEHSLANLKDGHLKNAIDFTNTNNEYSNIENTIIHSWKHPKTKFPTDEELTKHFGFEFTTPTKTSYADPSVPTMTTQWGNIFKSYETSSPFHKMKKPNTETEESESILRKPKHKNKHGKLPKGKTVEDWNREVAERFKSEEELLGLRNHDTSHPSYLPTYKLKDELNGMKNYASNFDYGSIVDKWRYLNSQSKRPDDLDAYPSDGHYKHHVPYAKPYPVEIPHPVIVPVPQPYPVRVPVPKPVAVPVIREIKVPVEKPVPYPVYKNVPYPVEKPVPVPIEKEIPVPVMKPYPVPIPHVRPVFHHSRPHAHGRPNSQYDDEVDHIDPDHAESHETRVRTEKLTIRPARNRRARIRPRRPPAQSRVYRRVSRRPPLRRQNPTSNYRRISRPPSHTPSKSRDTRRSKSPKTVNQKREQSQRNRHNPVRPTRPNTELGEVEREVRLGARYAPQFKDFTQEESDGHNHDDYFKYCQNNPLCYISSLQMPILE